MFLLNRRSLFTLIRLINVQPSLCNSLFMAVVTKSIPLDSIKTTLYEHDEAKCVLHCTMTSCDKFAYQPSKKRCFTLNDDPVVTNDVIEDVVVYSKVR